MCFKRYLIYGCATKLTSVKTKEKFSEVQLGSKHDNTMGERRRQPSTEQKKQEENIVRFDLILHREINTVHEFSCHAQIFVHV